MARKRWTTKSLLPLLFIFTALVISACNLSSSDATQEIDLTTAPTSTLQPSRTALSTGGAPTPIIIPSGQPTRTTITSRPTAIVILPPTSQNVFPTFTALPVNIAILSPVPGNVVSGAVQVLGAATHPQFLQYQLEFGPDPNPGNLWFPATSAVQAPVLNGLLGIWNTTTVQDALYQLRLRVYLRDGSTLTTVVNNIRVQNQAPTPRPTETQNIPRPIAAFTQDRTTGQVPLTVQFTNQSSGNVTSVLWNFGDGGTSTELNPRHTFNAPGLYNVTLTVTGPGGSSNVTRQISAQSATPPVAGFTMNQSSGVAPLPVQFVDQSQGTITNWLWNFSDGTTSTDRNPSHVFVVPGTYNVFLTVTGPGGSSSVTRQITVTGPTPTFTSTFTNTPVTPTLTPTNTTTPVTPTSTFTDTVTFTPTSTTAITETPTNTTTPVTPTDTPSATATATGTNTTIPPTETGTATETSTATVTSTDTLIPPTFTDTASPTPTDTLVPPTETPTDTLPPPTDTPTETPTNTLEPINVSFTYAQTEGLTVAFTNGTTGPAVAFLWEFNDGTGSTSAEVSPTYTFPQAGTYLVRLTATAGDGQTFPYEAEVIVESTQVDPGLAGTTPLLPDIGALYPTLRPIYENGVNSFGSRATVFAHAGDGTLRHNGILDTFAPGGSYNLADNGDLQAIIDWYNLVAIDSGTSFNRESVAASDNWRVEDLINPNNTPGGCNSGESPLACEIRVIQPAVMLLSIGYQDVLQNTDPNAFRANLEAAVQTLTNSGVIPVLFTVRPVTGSEAQVAAINDAIIQVASSYNVPVANLWRALNDMPDQGQTGGGGLTSAPGGAGDFSGGNMTTYGANAVNYGVLRVLYNLRNNIFPDASP